jgi:Omp85 superfamily domain
LARRVHTNAGMWRASIVTAALLWALPATAQPREGPSYPGNEPQGLISEPQVIERAALFAGRNLNGGGGSEGIYVDVMNMIPGAGWLAAGPGYRRWYSGDRLLFDTSAAISLRGYRTAQTRVELSGLTNGKLTVGSQFRWQDATQINAFGQGPDTLESNHAQYRMRSSNLVGYATLRPWRSVAIGGQGGWLKPSIHDPSGPFRSNRPSLRAMLPGDPAFALEEQPGFVYGQTSITADTRDAAGHATRGGLLRGAASTYSDRRSGSFSFRRYEGEAEGFVPLADSRVVVALHGWLVASDTSDGRFVPFYLQPSLGGANTLRGYTDYRFHDRNMLVLNLETRVALMTHMDVAVFLDAGNVAPRIGDLDLDKRSYGAGLRLHSRRNTFARVDVARGGEGWRFLFRLNDPLSLSRLLRRTAPVPFVP